MIGSITTCWCYQVFAGGRKRYSYMNEQALAAAFAHKRPTAISLSSFDGCRRVKHAYSWVRSGCASWPAELV
jgi:hypothetical protein